MSKVTYNMIYQVCGQVTADIPDDIKTREEAVAYLEKNWKNMPFPKNAEYICDSEKLDTEGEITITPNDSVNLRSPSPVLDERSRRSLRCCVDGVSDSPYTSSNLRTDGQPNCSGSDCLQHSFPDGKPGRGLPSIDNGEE